MSESNNIESNSQKDEIKGTIQIKTVIFILILSLTLVVGIGLGYLLKNNQPPVAFDSDRPRPDMNMPPQEMREDATNTSVVATPTQTSVADVTTYDETDVIKIDLNNLDNMVTNNVESTTTQLLITATADQKYSLTGSIAKQIVFTGTGDLYVELNNVDISSSDGPALLFKNNGLSVVTLKADTQNFLADGIADDDYDATLFSVNTLAINGAGTLTVTGTSEEGIASDTNLIIQNGNINVTAKDDGLNAQTDITINGGNLLIVAEGDGIDSNNSLTITGGLVIAQSGITDASGGLDADGAITITGGTVIATGANNALPNSNTSQKYLLINPQRNIGISEIITIANDNEILASFESSAIYQQLLFSAEAITDNTEYTIYTGGTVTGSSLNGYYAKPVHTAGTVLTTTNTAAIVNTTNRGGGRPMP